MTDRPDGSARGLARLLGLASLGLGVPMLTSTAAMARLVGVDDSRTAPQVMRSVGYRELGHAAALLVGPPGLVWTRVAGDALDLAVLGHAASNRSGARRERVLLATAAVAGITALDLYAAKRAGRARQHGRGRPGPLSVKATITVNRPVDEVYAYWRDFENLPTFMRHLLEVTVDEDGRTSHWKAAAPIKKSVSWDAELTGDEPGRRISWKSLKKAAVDNSGTVHFAQAPGDRGTEVRVHLHYDVPGGAVGRAVAKLLGEEPEQQVRDDLRRFKQVLETGDVVRSDGLPQGTDARHQAVQRPARPPKPHQTPDPTPETRKAHR